MYVCFYNHTDRATFHSGIHVLLFLNKLLPTPSRPFMTLSTLVTRWLLIDHSFHTKEDDFLMMIQGGHGFVRLPVSADHFFGAVSSHLEETSASVEDGAIGTSSIRDNESLLECL